MTYPDRELQARRHDGFIFAVVLLALLLIAFAAEASYRSRVCISAATVDETGTVTSTPVVCN